MADEYLTTAPAQRTIVATKGADIRVALHRRDSVGDPLDWDGDVFLDVDLSSEVTQRIPATVDGADAMLIVESEVADLIRNRSRWRIIFSAGDVQIGLLVGRIERHDG